MFLNHIAVTNLYGDNLNPSINFDSEIPITYIIGRNGCGKTTLLKIIEAVSKRNWLYLEELTFDNIALEFDDSQIKLSIIKNHDTDELLINFNDSIKNISLTQEKLAPYSYNKKEVDILISRLVARGILTELSCGHWSSKNRNHLREKDILKKFGKSLHDIPIHIAYVINEFRVSFIGAERLRDDIEKEMDPYHHKNPKQSRCYKIESIALDIKERLQRTQQKVLRKLEKISDELMSDLLKNGISNFDSILKDEFNNLLSKYNSDRVRFDTVGLSSGKDIKDLEERVIDDKERGLIAYIIKKRMEAYQPYNDVIVSFELFNEIVNSAITRKKIELTMPEGLIVKTQNENKFPVNSLSSGEQQIVILAHSLLFEIKKKSLVLIDEPEISMDVEWQSRLSEWLDRINKERSLKFILATHSPLVLSGRNQAIRPLNID